MALETRRAQLKTKRRQSAGPPRRFASFGDAITGGSFWTVFSTNSALSQQPPTRLSGVYSLEDGRGWRHELLMTSPESHPTEQLLA